MTGGERPVERLLAQLQRVTRTGNGYMSLCPAHEDTTPSLSIATGNDGRVLVKCFAGCAVENIVTAVGLTTADLFAGDGVVGGGRRPRGRGLKNDTPPAGGRGGVSLPPGDSNTRTVGLTLAQYAEAKQLPLDFLRGLGLSDIYVGQPVMRIPYLDETGQELAVHLRFALEKGPDRFKWRRGSKLCLYGLNRLPEARAAGSVVVVEGESDCHTLWHHGFPALGLPGANTWREEWCGYFDGIATVYVVVEPDAGGEAVKKWLATSTIRDRVRLVRLVGVKDPSALHVAAPGAFAAAWRAAVAKAVPWIDLDQAEQQREAADAYTAASDLLHDPGILERVGEAMRRAGYAGDLTPPLLAYVAMTSRLLERPMNLVFVAPSAAGKNRAVDAAAALIPPEAIHVEKAGSARALVYADENYQHRVVIVNEADSIPDEGPAASAIRSLAADNSMTYDVVERDERTGRHRTRHIVKPGPTGLLTTSTKSLPAQFGTRHLEVPLSDDAAQTRAVMLAHALSVTGTNGTAPDPAPFLALQRWLALAGAKAVIVPFATVLSGLVPAATVRMRRDFRQLLTCVQTIALLRQCQRERTVDGAVIATVDDYGAARTLLVSVFDTIVADGVTPAVRETVGAVTDQEEVSAGELAQRLKLSKSALSYRLGRALKGGWLVNNETRRGCAARLARGAPLPEAVTALPEPSRVREVFECSSLHGGERRTPLPPATVADALNIFPGATVVTCRACGGPTWHRAGDGEVCARCHPAPGKLTPPEVPGA